MQENQENTSPLVISSYLSLSVPEVPRLVAILTCPVCYELQEHPTSTPLPPHILLALHQEVPSVQTSVPNMPLHGVRAEPQGGQDCGGRGDAGQTFD